MTNETGESVVVRDTSGGYMQQHAVAIGTDAPAFPENAGYNSIAVFDANFAVVVGEAYNGQGYIGKVAG
jgi:hypothetical protein